ncbi:MAG: RagB/SusD family nutrient uptake outer membrane protein [Prevotella sp.]|nr:RagB/SusD family nutrient uptake outer membrane protein [Prevotella sp.]
MKIYNYIIGGMLAMSLPMMTSCNDLFDDAPINQITEGTVWTNSMQLDQYVNTWYRNMNNGFNHFIFTMSGYGAMSRYFLPWFGDQITVGKGDWLNSGYGDILKGNENTITAWAQGTWSSYYTQIQYINSFFENSHRIADGKQKTRITGEAHFFRAYYYYLLWQRFGGSLLIDHVVDPLKNPEKTPRASYQEMVDFIVKEAEAAANILPISHDAANIGRATKGAALMLKAKTYFWAASEMFQNKEKDYLGFTDNQAQTMLTKAKQAYEELFGLNVYELIPIAATTEDGIKDEYRKIFLMKNSQESIFEVQHSNDGDYANKFGHRLDRFSAAPSFTGTYCAYTPTHNHVMEYDMRDGAVYDAQNPYLNRDYRFYANILYDGSTYRGHQMEIHTKDGEKGADLKPYGTSTTAGYTLTGYYMAKFLDESQAIDNNDTYASKQNYIIWRLAEAKLDYAEVCFRLGDAATALQQVNDIRNRVKMNAKTTIELDDILKERRVEMAFEETTYWDYFRLGTAMEKLNGGTNPLKKIDITIKNDTKTYTMSNLDRRAKNNWVFMEKEYYFPIPWSEIKYQGIEQNPGWNEV